MENWKRKRGKNFKIWKKEKIEKKKVEKRKRKKGKRRKIRKK